MIKFIFILFFGQQDSLKVDIPTVEISSTRLNAHQVSKKHSVGIDSNTLLLSRGVNIGDILTRNTNIFAQSSENFSQDLRLSIRGYGMRSAFGIRGIKIVVDGIPESTPDGQGDVDNIESTSISNINILAGPANSVYSNATGGVIEMSTYNPNSKFEVNANTLIGSFGLLKQSLSIGSKSKSNILSVNLGALNFDGYRNHSKHTNYNGQIKWISAISSKVSNQLILNAFYNPISQDPGGLLLEEVMNDPRQGRSQSILFNAGENMWQYKLSNLINIKTSNLSELFISFFTQKRDFQNRLPFRNDGAVAFVRNIYGAQAGFKKRKLLMDDDLFQAGIETDYQLDQRNRFANLNGENGAMTLDQDEIFRSLGTYFSYSAKIKKWDLLFSGRYENIQITLNDQFLNNGDQSGDKSYLPFTGTTRLGYNFTKQWSVNVSFISGFETPTLTEIINNPEGFGFAAIDPAYTQGWELMTQYKTANHIIKLTGYQYQSSNELVPYQVANQVGRVFFRNGGKSDRIGLEGEIHTQFNSWLSSIVSGSINQFNLSADLTSEPKVLAGIPENNLRTAIVFSPSKVSNIMVDFISNGSIFADQNNTIRIAPQSGLNFHADHTFAIKQLSITPSFGGRYMLSELNYNNILINAAANRYYEPLSRMSWYVKLAMAFKR